MNDIEVKEMEIFDSRKKVTEAECKLKQQENLLESVVSERNLYSRNLIEAQVGSSVVEDQLALPVPQLYSTYT